jgi:Pyruvate/2-oxoacid:ferredoxin oxidoreductase gamma subunit
VYAEMRISSGVLPVVGPSIPAGKLDILVALDPWEALRHLRLAHGGTVCYCETEPMPFFTDRSVNSDREIPGTGPIELLQKLPLAITWRQYRQQAMHRDGTAQMANYFAGLDCLTALGLGNSNAYERIFFATINTHQEVSPCN